jgi:hypothetical protein
MTRRSLLANDEHDPIISSPVRVLTQRCEECKSYLAPGAYSSTQTYGYNCYNHKVEAESHVLVSVSRLMADE